MNLREYVEKKMIEREIQYVANPTGLKDDEKIFPTGNMAVDDAIEIAYGILRDMGAPDNDFEMDLKIEVEDEKN